MEGVDIMRIFSPDSLLMRFMSRVGDLLILNLLFLVCCIPVFTIGTAWTALYRVCFDFDTGREQGLMKTFFGSFRENFKQGTFLWLFLLVCGTATAVNTALFYSLQGALHYAFILFGAMSVLVLITAALVFPLLSLFSNHWKETLKNGMFLGIGYFPRALLMAAVNIAPFAFLVLDFYRFLQLGFVWVALYFSCAAYVGTFLLKKIFAPYLSEEDDHDHTENETK